MVNRNKKNNIKEIDIKIPKATEKKIIKMEKGLIKSTKHKSRDSSAPLATALTSRKEKFKIKYSKDVVRISGRCLAATISSPNTTGISGTRLVRRIVIHPSSIGSRRLNTFLKLFQRYKFTSLSAEYVPVVPATTAGELHFAWTEDIQTVVPDGGMSLRGWFFEMEGANSCNVWSPHRINAHRNVGELKSYLLSEESGEINTVFQAALVIGSSGIAENSYLGDLMIEYEIELSHPAVPALTYKNELQTLTVTVNAISSGQPFKWKVTEADAVKFWSMNQGVYYCTSAVENSILSKSELSGKFGTSFVLDVQGGYGTGMITTWTEMTFTVYKNLSAVLADNPIEIIEAVTTAAGLQFYGTMLMATDPYPVVTDNNIVNEHDPKGPLGIGIGVGPGVLAGELDVTPTIGFDGGRLVCPNPYYMREEKDEIPLKFRRKTRLM